MATAIASNRASSASAGRKAHCPASLPRCSLRGRSGARHAHVAARGSAPPIPFAARRGDRFPGRDGKAGSSIELESCAPAGRPSVMHFYSGPPMHLLSGVDIDRTDDEKSRPLRAQITTLTRKAFMGQTDDPIIAFAKAMTKVQATPRFDASNNETDLGMRVAIEALEGAR